MYNVHIQFTEYAPEKEFKYLSGEITALEIDTHIVV